MIDDIVEAQGWTDDTLLKLATDFISECGLDDDFREWLMERARWERAPSQSEIDDNIVLCQKGDDWEIWSSGHRIHRTKSDKAMFEHLAKNSEGMRIFSVNDHGNVTEYDVTGKVIGEWV